ncbi:MAG: pyridoxamine 5'-phosphate oxidase family protein [Blastocatellia bacterium]|nr:pyridoxamine 5'-phosphate oxidase family protein [Blastocatellia bacterium]
MTTFTPTGRSKLRRLPTRGYTDRETIYKILDEGLLCHIGFAVDGQPYVIPTSYARAEDTLYVHGSAASRMLKELQKGVPACVTVTLLDGLVLARSVFHHSMNYRSVVAFGRAALITDADKKIEALRAITEHIISGRWADARTPNEKELNQTSVLEFSIEEASAKIRTGPPLDDEEDYALPVWAGVVPLELNALAPIRDPRLSDGMAPPTYAAEYQRPNSNRSGRKD